MADREEISVFFYTSQIKFFLERNTLFFSTRALSMLCAWARKLSLRLWLEDRAAHLPISENIGIKIGY